MNRFDWFSRRKTATATSTAGSAPYSRAYWANCRRFLAGPVMVVASMIASRRMVFIATVPTSGNTFHKAIGRGFPSPAAPSRYRLAEIERSADQDRQGRKTGDKEHGIRRPPASQDRPAKPLHHAQDRKSVV